MEDLEDVNHNYTTKTNEYTFSGILKAPLIFSHFNPAINHSTNLSQGDEKRRIFLWISFSKTNRGESWPWPASKFHNIYIKMLFMLVSETNFNFGGPMLLGGANSWVVISQGIRLQTMSWRHAATLISPHREQENQSNPGPGFKILFTRLLILFLLFKGVSRRTPRPALGSGTYYSIYVLQTTDPRPWLWESTFHELFRLWYTQTITIYFKNKTCVKDPSVNQYRRKCV